jgi:hypothetical protein
MGQAKLLLTLSTGLHFGSCGPDPTDALNDPAVTGCSGNASRRSRRSVAKSTGLFANPYRAPRPLPCITKSPVTISCSI